MRRCVGLCLIHWEAGWESPSPARCPELLQAGPRVLCPGLGSTAGPALCPGPAGTSILVAPSAGL